MDGKSIILEEGLRSLDSTDLDATHFFLEFDPTYEPTPDEIKEYAEFLGMVQPEDDALLWIAREGLKAPLPKDWKPCQTLDGEVGGIM